MFKLGFSFFSFLVLEAAVATPAVVYESVNFDESFNVAANDGIERYKKEFGPAKQAFGRAAIRRFAQEGAEPVIAIGFALADEVRTVAKEFPKVRFTVIDTVVDLPNVQSIIFKDHEGAYLVGMLAAMASKSAKIGFVGGMDIPTIRRFQCGYEHGALRINPQVKTLAVIVGDTNKVWSDPERGGVLAKGLFEQGVDVVFAAAGGTGVGVYEAAKSAGKLAIGVDRNQNSIHPGTMLTSMVKRIDVAVYLAAQGVRSQTWAGGKVLSLGLKEQGLAWALDRHNRALVSADMQRQLEQAQSDIVSGRTKVWEYTPEAGCPKK
jgi:basic membrane protein A and related proteins